MPFWKAGKNDDQVLDELKETQKQTADEFVKKQEHADEAQKSSLIIDNNFTPVEYDPQYILQVNHLKKYFPIKGGMVSKTVGYVKAVDGVTFNLKRGTTMGLVGESGCGKSTLGRVAMGIYPATSGKLYYAGEELNLKNAATRFKYAKKAQIIFQDPYASLDPRMTVSSIIEEGMVIHGMYDAKRRQERVYELLELVGLNKEHANRFPHEFSGGQRQRIGIARALAIEPEFIVCDEPISALDVSIQSQIINLLHDLQQQLGLTFLFIAHDLNIVKYISDRIAVMYLGNVVELASSDDLYAHTLHPYSKALLSAVPIPDPSAEAQKHRQILSGDVPSPINTPKGCNFAGRCPVACDKCRESKPQLREIRPGHFCACHLEEGQGT